MTVSATIQNPTFCWKGFVATTFHFQAGQQTAYGFVATSTAKIRVTLQMPESIGC